MSYLDIRSLRSLDDFYNYLDIPVSLRVEGGDRMKVLATFKNFLMRSSIDLSDDIGRSRELILDAIEVVQMESQGLLTEPSISCSGCIGCS